MEVLLSLVRDTGFSNASLVADLRWLWRERQEQAEGINGENDRGAQQ